MSDADHGFPEFAMAYTDRARALRKALSDEVRTALMEIEDELSENPESYAHRTVWISDDTFVYKYPKPTVELTCKVDNERKVINVTHVVAPAMTTTTPLFISYSHQDIRWLKDLRKFLDPLEKRDLVKIWDDREIKAGEKWRDEIQNSLSSAKVALLLVSQDFLVSEFISSQELPQLLKAASSEGVKVLWIALSASTVKDTDIFKFQSVNNPAAPLDGLTKAKRNNELLQIYKKIKAVVEG